MRRTAFARGVRMNLSDEELEVLWFKISSGQGSPHEQEQLKAFLQSAQNRSRWRSLLNFESDLARGLALSTPKISGAPTEGVPLLSTSRHKSAPQRQLLRWMGWGSIAALLMITWIVAFQLGWLKGPPNNNSLGQVLSVVGEVRVHRGLLHIGLMPSMVIKEDDDIFTDGSAALWIKLKDNTVLRLGEKAHLRIGGQRFEANKSLQLVRGHLYCEVQSQKNPMTIETPYQNISILGTRFAVRVLDATEGVQEMDGLERLDLFEGHLQVFPSNKKFGGLVSDLRIGVDQEVGNDQGGPDQLKTSAHFDLRACESLLVKPTVDFEKKALPVVEMELIYETAISERELWMFRKGQDLVAVEIPYKVEGEKTTRNTELLHKMQTLVRGDKITCVLEKSDVYILKKLAKWGKHHE